MWRKPSASAWMIVGLGNPGKEYEHTRHNIGFRAVDLLAKELGVKIDRVKCRGLMGRASIAGEKVLLLKPQTFMNNSGEAVFLAAQYYKVPTAHIIVLYDDISLPVGRLRVRPDGSAGGHNGIRSIIAHLGSQDFPRVKIGVGAKPHPDYDLADWVLSAFPSQAEEHLAPTLANAVAAAKEIVENGTYSAANRYNGKAT